VRREVHHLPRANPEHRRHPQPDEQGDMGL
jgi:hypothetical protein